MLLMTALNKAVSESHYLPQMVLREVLDLRHRMDAYLAMTKPFIRAVLCGVYCLN